MVNELATANSCAAVGKREQFGTKGFLFSIRRSENWQANLWTLHLHRNTIFCIHFVSSELSTFRVQTFARNHALNFNAGNRLVTNCTSIIAQINVRIDKQHCPKRVERNKDYVELLVINLTEKMAMWLRQCQYLFAFVYPPKSIRYRPLFTTNALFIKKTDVDFSSIYKEAQSNRWINKTNAMRRKWTIQWITQKLLKHCAGR